MINVCPNDLSWWVADTWTGLYLFPGKYGPTRFKLFCFVFNVNTPTILSVTLEVDEAWSNTASISWFIVSWVQREFPLTFILKRLGNEWHLACIGTTGIYVLSCECTRLREDLFFVTAVHTKSWTSLSLSSVDTGPWREVLEGHFQRLALPVASLRLYVQVLLLNLPAAGGGHLAVQLLGHFLPGYPGGT